MTKVFIGGSRHISRLNAQVHRRLDNIVENELPVLIGDANGADKAVQQYLSSRHYHRVEVFCSNGVCRNNLGRWEVRVVPSETRERGFEFYAAKDRAMAQEATVGFMIWDGNSVGTLLNVFRLLRRHKKIVVYSAPKRVFSELKQSSDWDEFMAGYGVEIRRKVEQRAALEVSEIGSSEQISLAI